MRRLLNLAAAFTFCVVLSSASAEGLPREFTVNPEALAEAPSYMSQVVVADAQCASVNDAGTLLVVGRRSATEQHLAVFHLDAMGAPTGEPAWITMPKPETLADKASYALGLLFHPRLPVLYVWQDVDASAKENDPERPKYAEFDHLLVYAIKDGALELVQTGSPGSAFRCGFSAGTVGFDYGEKNLFVPNAMGESWTEAGVTSYTLDEEGMPGEEPEAPSPTKAKLIKNYTPSKNAKKTPHLVPQPRKLHTSHYYPSGTGWYAGSEALIMGGYAGCLMFDLHEGALRQTWFGLPDLAGPCTIAPHPTLPTLYMALQDNTHFYAVAQAYGFVSLMPQVATVTGTHFAGMPAVITKHARVAIGDAKSLHLLGLRDDGKLDGMDEQLKLPAAIVKGYAYSEKNDRLYVAVDKEK